MLRKIFRFLFLVLGLHELVCLAGAGFALFVIAGVLAGRI